MSPRGNKADTQKADTKKADTKKTEAKKESAPAVTEAPVKAKPKKAAVLKETVILQYAGRELDTASIMKQVKSYWTKELKNKVGDMKTVTLYLKPEDGKAYFVINDDTTGSVEL